MTPTFVSLFTGGGGADIGARAAGYELIAGLELDPRIAAVANANLGGHVRVGDILKADPHSFPQCDLLHASPPCPNFSVAKHGAAESPHDIALAEKVAEFICVLCPPAFTLENVPAYRKSRSYALVLSALHTAGYMTDVHILNSADYGVPQTRRRLWLRAVHGSLLPLLPPPTRMIGWYEAIEDLLPYLPTAIHPQDQPCEYDPQGQPCLRSPHCRGHFAAWQRDRLPQEFCDVLLGGGNRSKSFLEFARTNRPTVPSKHKRAQSAPTISATASSDMCAFLVNNHFGAPDGSVINARRARSPAHSVTVLNPMRALLENRHQSERDDYFREDQEPAYTVSPGDVGRRCAFLLDGEPANDMGDLRIADESKQMVVVTGGVSQHSSQVFILGAGTRSGLREKIEPTETITGNSNQATAIRAYLSPGRVVAMTPRCLARFQSFPDAYRFPESARHNRRKWELAKRTGMGIEYERVREWLVTDSQVVTKILGNAVPPLQYEAIAAQFCR